MRFENLLAEAMANGVRVRIKNGRLNPQVKKGIIDTGSREALFAAFQTCRDLIAQERDIVKYLSQKQLNRILSSSSREPEVGRLGELTGLLSRLQAYSWWLTEERRFYRTGNAFAADDITFSKKLNRWKMLQKKVRELGYTACIFGPGRTCPDTAAVLCDASNG